MSGEVPDGVKYFNFVALSILYKLYENFPKEIEINCQKLATDCLPKEFLEADEEKAFAVIRSGADTMTWLQSEGFVTVQSYNLDGDASGCRLTLRGLVALGAVPASIAGNSNQESFGVLAKSAMKKGIGTFANEVFTTLIKSALPYYGIS